MTATTGVTGLPHGRPFTRGDLDRMPDDGNRYELLDGMLVVSPAPLIIHQRVSRRLMRALDDACPPGLTVLYAPVDVVLSADSVLQPDLLAARDSDFTDKDLPTAPLLAIEILSPSTRRYDLILKRSRYEEAGCVSYWVVDPAEPSITAWELRDGAYGLAGRAVGDERLELELPFPVAIVPAQLTT